MHRNLAGKKRATPRVPPQVSDVPHLLPQPGPAGRDSRGHQGLLVAPRDAGQESRLAMTDPIADMLTRIRNANQALLEKVDMPASRFKVEIAKTLKAEGFIRAYKLIDDNKQGVLRVYLKFGPGNERVILGLRRGSRPGPPGYRRAAPTAR